MAFILLAFVVLCTLALLVRLLTRQSSNRLQRAPILKTPHAIFTEDSGYRMHVRQFERVDMKLKTTYQIDHEEEKIRCTVVDMSPTGVGFICKEHLDSGSRVKLILPNLDKGSKEREFEVSGQIVRSRELDKSGEDKEYGVKFYHILKPGSDLLEKILIKYR